MRMMLVLTFAAAGVLAAQPAAAQEKQTESARYSGSYLYRTYCAVCHGRTARGDGPLADQMKKPPPELTRYAQRNGGVYPSAMVARIIDGRNPLPGHGGPDMPVWGDVFKAGRGATEADVKARIDALVKYIETLQLKTAARQHQPPPAAR
jgi:mono/diheme cytochrome c family protein